MYRKEIDLRKMTYDNIFEEVGCPAELKRHKREIAKLRKIIDSLETEINLQDSALQSLKERLNECKKI